MKVNFSFIFFIFFFVIFRIPTLRKMLNVIYFLFFLFSFLFFFLLQCGTVDVCILLRFLLLLFFFHWILFVSSLQIFSRFTSICDGCSQLGCRQINMGSGSTPFENIKKKQRNETKNISGLVQIYKRTNELQQNVYHNNTTTIVSPMIFVPNQLVGAPAGTDVTIDCNTEAHPKYIKNPFLYYRYIQNIVFCFCFLFPRNFFFLLVVASSTRKGKKENKNGEW